MLPYNFGLEGIVGMVLYGACIVTFFLSIFWRPIAGIYYLAPLLPLQTIRYRMNEFPLGSSAIALVLIGVGIGLIRRRQSLFFKTPWTVLLYSYCGYILLSYWLGSIYLGRSSPMSLDDPRLGDWKDYMLMPLILLLAAGAVTTVRQMKVLVLLMCLSILVVDKGFWGTVADRDYSEYSDDMREAGVLGQAGANGLGAFEAQAAALLLVLAAFEKGKLLKLGYYALAIFSAVCLMYSFSRGGWVAFAAVLVFIGVVKQRKLLIGMVIFGILWASVVPEAVRSRVSMTTDQGELDHSSETRVTLWEDAMELVSQNPVTGTGFDTYAFMGRVGNYRDTHNIYLKVLVETGAIGLALFLALMGQMFFIGLRLFRRTQEPLLRALGLGLSSWLLCSAVANFFGDRWTFLQVNGLMWLIAGLVTRGLMIEKNREEDDSELTAEESANDSAVTELQAQPATA